MDMKVSWYFVALSLVRSAFALQLYNDSGRQTSGRGLSSIPWNFCDANVIMYRNLRLRDEFAWRKGVVEFAVLMS